MTSDLDATTDDLFSTIRDLWQAAQDGTGDAAAPAGGGQAVSIPDTAVADRTGLDLAAVREFIDNADGVKLTAGRDGETRTVEGLLAD
ncbi:hypothetical protein GCM10023339_02200 [Alloalcanivorax gelatiniphagus]